MCDFYMKDVLKSVVKLILALSKQPKRTFNEDDFSLYQTNFYEDIFFSLNKGQMNKDAGVI